MQHTATHECNTLQHTIPCIAMSCNLSRKNGSSCTYIARKYLLFVWMIHMLNRTNSLIQSLCMILFSHNPCIQNIFSLAKQFVYSQYILYAMHTSQTCIRIKHMSRFLPRKTSKKWPWAYPIEQWIVVGSLFWSLEYCIQHPCVYMHPHTHTHTRTHM